MAGNFVWSALLLAWCSELRRRKSGIDSRIFQSRHTFRNLHSHRIWVR